jgi:oligopeptide transport system ATP-binding protein
MTSSESKPEKILEVSDLHTEFLTEHGIVKAVRGASFYIDLGETLGVVGESGSGKSVTMLSIMGLIESPPGKVTQGEVYFDGINLVDLSSEEIRNIRGKDIAMVFQDPMTSLNPVFTIGEQLFEALRAHKPLSKKECRRQSADLLNLVGIPEPLRALDDYPHQFSGGMRQRVMIAMALSCNPRLLIADEPTTALDVTVQEQLLELIENLRDQMNMSVIWITHDLGVVAGISDRVLVMYAGRIVEKGPVHKIFADPRHPYTLGLLRSIPRLDSTEDKHLDVIPGSPPDLIRLPQGCTFAPRCQFRVDQCLQEEPPIEEVEEGRFSACWVNPQF